MSCFIVCFQTTVFRASFETVSKVAVLTEFVKVAVNDAGGNYSRTIEKLKNLWRDEEKKSDIRGLCLLIRSIHSHVPDDRFRWHHLPVNTLIRHCSERIEPCKVRDMNRMSLGLLKSMKSALHMVVSRLMHINGQY